MQVCQVTFSEYRLLPMGSFARITHRGATHDLYGPVSRFTCTGYDSAQVAFLACLKVRSVLHRLLLVTLQPAAAC